MSAENSGQTACSASPQENQGQGFYLIRWSKQGQVTRVKAKDLWRNIAQGDIPATVQDSSGKNILPDLLSAWIPA